MIITISKPSESYLKKKKTPSGQCASFIFSVAKICGLDKFKRVNTSGLGGMVLKSAKELENFVRCVDLFT